MFNLAAQLTALVLLVTFHTTIVTSTIFNGDVINSVFHCDQTLFVKGIQQKASCTSSNYLYTAQICCTDTYCAEQYTSSKQLLHYASGCFLPNLQLTTMRGCMCEEHAPAEYQPCTAQNECFCGTIPVTKTATTLDGKPCAVKHLDIFATTFHDTNQDANTESNKQVKVKSTSLNSTPCDDAASMNTFQSGKLLLRCSLPLCRYNLLTDSSYTVYEIKANSSLSLTISDKYSKTASVSYFLEAVDCITSTITLTNQPIDYCTDQHAVFTLSGLVHPECFVGPMQTWLIAFWVLLALCVIATIATSIVLIRLFGCLCCCPVFVVMWRRLTRACIVCLPKGEKLLDSNEVELEDQSGAQVNPKTTDAIMLGSLSSEDMSEEQSQDKNLAQVVHEKYPQIKASELVLISLMSSCDEEIVVNVETNEQTNFPLTSLLSSSEAMVNSTRNYSVSTRSKRAIRTQNNISSLYPLLAIMIATYLPQQSHAASCTNINILQSSVPTCITKDSIKTCTNSLNMRFTIPSIGGNSCYELYDNDQNMIYKLSVITSQIGYEYATNLNYYTTMGTSTSYMHDNEYTVYCKNSCTDSKHRQECEGGYNDLWTWEDKRGYIKNSNRFWSNMQCASKCEGWWDCYYGWQVRPNFDTSAKVYTISSARSYAVVTLTEVTPNNTVTTKDVKLYTGSSLPVQFGLIEVENIIPSALPLINNYKLVTYNEKGVIRHLLTEAADKGMGQIGKIGEIQCSNSECNNPTGAKYYLSPDWLSLQKDLNSDMVKVYFPTFVYAKEDSLPRSVSGWSFQLSNNEIKASSTGNHKVDLFASYSGVVSVSIEQTIPIISLFNATCELGIGNKNYMQFVYTCKSNSDGCPLYCHSESGSKVIIDYLTCNNNQHTIPHLTGPSKCTHYTCGDLAVSPTCVVKEFINITGFAVEVGGDHTSTASTDWADWSIGTQLTTILVPIITLIVIVILVFVVIKVGLRCFNSKT